MISRVAHENEALFSVLRALRRAGVSFVTIGSAGLALLHPNVRAQYALPDLDVLISDTDESLAQFASWAWAEGFALRSWDAAFAPNEDPSVLRGRIYLRATRASVQLDATYESPVLALRSLEESARWIDGIPVCEPTWLWRSKLAKDPAAGLSFAVRYGIEVPPEAWDFEG
jgi:hypothetical protein